MKLIMACVSVSLWASCGDPVDAAGNYTLAITNRANGCGFMNWQEGAQTSGVPVVMTQAEAAVTADVGGAAAILLDVVFGSHVYTGEVSGDDLRLSLTGTRAGSQGNCTYTYNSTLSATLTGDALTGMLDYRAATNGGTDCGSLTGCSTMQEFNGTRPPQ